MRILYISGFISVTTLNMKWRSLDRLLLLLLSSLILFNFQTVSFSALTSVTSIIEMAISYNYEYLAMFTDTGLLWIGSADLQVGITLSHCLAHKFSYQRTSSSS